MCWCEPIAGAGSESSLVWKRHFLRRHDPRQVRWVYGLGVPESQPRARGSPVFLYCKEIGYRKFFKKIDEKVFSGQEGYLLADKPCVLSVLSLSKGPRASVP